MLLVGGADGVGVQGPGRAGVVGLPDAASDGAEVVARRVVRVPGDSHDAPAARRADATKTHRVEHGVDGE